MRFNEGISQPGDAPRTQTQALIPDLKVLALSTSPVSILQVMLIRVAMVSIKIPRSPRYAAAPGS